MTTPTLMDTSSLWDVLSVFHTNEGMKIKSADLFKTMFLKIPKAQIPTHVFISDPHLSTFTQQGALLLLFKEIYSCWDKVSRLVITLAIGKKKTEEFHSTGVVEIDRLTEQREKYLQIFRIVFSQTPAAELNVSLFTMLSNSNPNISRDRPIYQHDRFCLIRTAGNSGTALYKLSLSRGMDLFQNPSPRPITALLHPHASIWVQRGQIVLMKYRVDNNDTKKYFDLWVDVTLKDECEGINNFVKNELRRRDGNN